MLWGVSVAAEIVFFALAGRHFARLGEYRWLVLAQLTHALTFAAHHMACTSLIARHFPDRLRARGSALYTTLGYGVPGVVGGVAGGALSERFGLPAVFWAAALAALASAACCAQAARAARRAGPP
jgi:PPP family 3-phenylpropionic acid transporter